LPGRAGAGSLGSESTSRCGCRRCSRRTGHAGCGVGVDEELPRQGRLDEPPSGGRNGERDFHGATRSNDTHASTTDPDARLYRKGKGKEAELSAMH
jgi:hypothetical protein